MQREDFLTNVVRTALILWALGLVATCGGSDENSSESALSPAATNGLVPGEGPKVVVLGDSISAGLHLPFNEAWPSVLAELLAAEGLPIDLVNAGVSGDTTAGGLARLDWLLRQDPDLMIVELGANDGLRGVPLESVEANLRSIVSRLEAEQVRVLLLGMKLPPNYGAAYTTGFEQLFKRIAKDTGVAFMPFFLEGVAADPSLNLPDGIHPNTTGHQIVAKNLLPALRPLVRELGTVVKN